MSSPLYYQQSIVILDTSVSSNTSSGSLVMSGGLGIQGTLSGYNAVFTSTAQSLGSGSGALVINGGIGIAKDIYIGGDTFVTGNLYVNGTTTSINTTTVNIADNTLLLNSGPSGSRDAGILTQRYQVDNNLGTGDIVNVSEPIQYTAASAGGSTTTIIFPAGASIVTNFYTGWWIKITLAGTVNVRQITAYNGSTLTATVSSAFTQAPVTETFALYNRNYFAQYYDESQDILIFGYTVSANDVQVALNASNFANIKAGSVAASSATIGNIVATSLSAGNLTFSAASVTNMNITNSATIANALIVNSTVSNLVVTNSSILNNITANSLFISSSSILNGGVTLGSLYVSSGSVLNGVSISNLTATSNTLGSVLITGSSTVGSLFVSSSSILNGGATLGSLYVSSGSVLNGVSISNLTATSNTLGSVLITGSSTIGSLFVSNTSILNGGATLGSLYVSSGSVLNGVSISNLTATSNTLGSVLITGSSTIGSLFVSNTSILNGGATLGSLYVSSGSVLNGVSISNLNATNITSSSLKVTGSSVLSGVSASSLVINSVDITPSANDFLERSFAAANNTISFTNITGFAFSATTRSFEALCSVTIIATLNRYTHFTIRGVNKNGSWVINTQFIGDNNSGITFTINSSGQVQYTSSNVAGFVSDTMKFRAITLTV
jgi:hypothetical protein